MRRFLQQLSELWPVLVFTIPLSFAGTWALAQAFRELDEHERQLIELRSVPSDIRYIRNQLDEMSDDVKWLTRERDK